MRRTSAFPGTLAFLCSIVTATLPASLPAQTNGPHAAAAQIAGERLHGTAGVSERTDAIMRRQAAAPHKGPRPEHELEGPDRSDLLANPEAPAISRYPANAPAAATRPAASIHTPALAFDGATLADTGAFPPDSMGTVGPSQFMVFVNGRVRSFTKSGSADGVINADPDVFFASVMTPVGGSVTQVFTSDPQVRYDRFSARWFMSIIDVPCANAACSSTAANRWLLAVSDATSNGTISAATTWTFFQFQPDTGTGFCDYPSLGIDVNALYVGCNMFSAAGSFTGTNGYVIQKASVLGSGPMQVTRFANIATTAAGPYAPRGVDNLDASATAGYFVGPDVGVYSRIVFRRISNPGSATPTISANINVTVLTTSATNPVEHAGNTGGSNGRLDSLDDRLFAATIRNGRLWTAHNLRVNTSGVANTGTTARKASRWYEFQNLDTTPTLNQSGTVYDNASTLAAALQYWIPTATVTGQGHAIVGFSMAGTPSGATPGYVGRLAGDPLGTMVGPPSTGALLYGTTAANYNPASDPGGSSGRRWGDYSFTVVDPLDDMSVWTIQEYNQAANSYSVRVGKLQAPPPATPSCAATPIAFNAGTSDVVIGSTSNDGSGFYDPGADLPSPARPFNHLTATVSNATVNSVSYDSPTQITLNITANTAGARDVTITNPDGQSVTATGCINVTGSVPTTHTVTPSVTGGNGAIAPSTPQTVNHGATTSFTLTPAANYHVANVAGTCGGTLTGNTYTTDPVNADCTVIASFAIDTHTVTPSVTGGNGAIAPSTPQTVNHGATTSFTLTPAANYHVANVAGTCGGTLTGNTYTTDPVNADCTVIASFAIDTHTVTPSVTGGNGAIAPSTPQTVNHGATTSFTLTPAANFHVANVAGTCSGTLTGSTYTTNAVTADCTVIASFAADLRAPTLAKAFAPTSVVAHVPSTVTLTLANTNASAASLSAALTDTLPAGLVVATPSNAATTCPAGTVSATPGAGSFSLSASAQIPANGSCTISVSVVAAVAGSYTNTLAAGALQTNVGANAAAASAQLTVTPVLITDRIFCDGFEGTACSNTTAAVAAYGGELVGYLLGR
jgi:filamentous hemagglutinin family protein